MHPHAHHPNALPLRVLAWEITRRCPMACTHCRGASRNLPYENELTTEEALRVIDSLHAASSHPLIIFTGGEPMYRDDLETIVAYAAQKGFPCALAPCGKFASRERLQRLKDAGIQALSISIDGPTAEAHDTFRGIKGAFQFALEAMAAARDVGIGFQINHTVTKQTQHTLRAMRDFAIEQNATRIDYFFLVPVGRGAAIANLAMDDVETEKALDEILDLDAEGSLPVHVTCAPNIVRKIKERAQPPKSRFNGCMAGAGFCFLSHLGDLQPCGFFDLSAGNVRSFDYNFPAAFQASQLFQSLHAGPVGGACGGCAFRLACRGCRARAYALTANPLSPDPSCSIQP